MCSIIRRQAKVETQNLASHKQGFAICRGDYMPVIAAFTARETQNLASLQADAIIIINSKCVL